MCVKIPIHYQITIFFEYSISTCHFLYFNVILLQYGVDRITKKQFYFLFLIFLFFILFKKKFKNGDYA